MAKKKSKKKGQKRRPVVDGARLERALGTLSEGNVPEDLDDGLFQALVSKLTAQGDGQGLSALAALASHKEQERLVKRGQFLLNQRAPSGAKSAARGTQAGHTGDSLPVLMAPPRRNSARIFTFTMGQGSNLRVVEAYFSEPEGLYRLQATGTSREAYVPWAKEMLTKRLEGFVALPERVVVSDAMLRRKRWEMGRMAKARRLGPEVDPSLLREVGIQGGAPAHPAADNPFSGARVLTMDDLWAKAGCLDALHHTMPMLQLRKDWREAGEHDFIKSVGPTSMWSAVSDWVTQWGPEAARETLLDMSAFQAAMGDKDAAFTFQQLALRQSQDDRQEMVNFLHGIVVRILSEENRSI